MIRTRFSKLVHYCEQEDFRCTFSCGIASYPEFRNEKTISEEADKALYQAKEAGRNKVVCAKSVS